jgi:hypothetical protein
MKFMKKILYLLVFVTACHKLNLGSQSSPAKTTELFIYKSSHAKKMEDKKGLEEMSTSLILDVFKNMDEARFRDFYIQKNIDVKKITILNIEEEGDRAKVRYQVVVNNLATQPPAEETLERELTLTKTQNGNWIQPTKWSVNWIQVLSQDKIAFTQGMVF